MRPHRETYPEQYTHSLCGKRVQVVLPGRTINGTFERAIQTRFGLLVILAEIGPKEAFSVNNVKELPDDFKTE